MHPLLLSAVALTQVDPADPTGLARGRYPVQAWVIWIWAGGVVLLAILILAVRLARARRARKAGEGPGKRP